MSHLTRRITPLMLFMISVNGIVGSGWLLAPLYVAKIAGPAAIFSWVLGGLAVILIAFTFAELSTMFPIAGGTARLPHLSHGPLASFLLGWIAWLTSVLMAPIEVQAVLLYASMYFPLLVNQVNGTPMLSYYGVMWAVCLLASLSLINIVSYRLLLKCNTAITIFKFSIIFITIIVFYQTRFVTANFTGLTASVVTLPGWHAIFGAIATGGIVFAFNGFKTGVELAGETQKLSLAIPLSTIGSVVACALLYIALQFVFIGVIAPSSLQHGWNQLNFAGDVGPFMGLALALGLFWLVKIIYVNAIVSPLGAGLIYVTSTARIVYAMSKMGYLPEKFAKLNRQHLPMTAIMINFIVGAFAFLPFPGWQSMMSFLVSAMVITYAMGPVALMTLRLSMPDQERPFRLPCASYLCLLAFYFCNLFCYWTGWETMFRLAIALSFGFIVFILAYLKGSVNIHLKEMKSASWFIPYLCGLFIISYCGSYGGKGYIAFGWDFVVIGLFSVLIFYLAIYSRAPSIDMDKALGMESI